MHTARYKQIKNPILLLQNSIAIIFCALGALANKFLAICYCHNVEQTGFYIIILIKKTNVLPQQLYQGFNLFHYIVGDNDLTHSFFEGHNPHLCFFFTPFLPRPPPPRPTPSLCLEIFPITLLKPNFFNGTFFLLFNLKVKE